MPFPSCDPVVRPKPTLTTNRSVKTTCVTRWRNGFVAVAGLFLLLGTFLSRTAHGQVYDGQVSRAACENPADGWKSVDAQRAIHYQETAAVQPAQVPVAVPSQSEDPGSGSAANAATGPPPEAPRPETLEEAWRVALENDQRIQAGGWNVSAANQTRAAACAAGYPSVDLGANCLALSDKISVDVAGPPVAGEFPLVAQTSVGFHATVTQPLYTGGKNQSEIAAAEAEVSANRADVQNTKLDVKMNVAVLYVAVLRGQRVLEVARSKVASLAAHARDVENRFRADKATRNELLAVEVALADARQQAVAAENTLTATKAGYNRALGRDFSEEVHVTELRDDGEPPGLDDLTRAAWQHRPELAALAAQATNLREQAAAANSQSAPQVSLQGGYLYQEDKYLQPNGVAGIALTAQWNVFDWGRAGHQANALCQRAEGLMRMRKDAESMIALEIRQRWLELQTARQQIAYARVAIEQADENLRVARQRYVQSLGNNTEVLDAQTLRTQAFMNFYNASYEAVLVRLRLRCAAGVL